MTARGQQLLIWALLLTTAWFGTLLLIHGAQ